MRALEEGEIVTALIAGQVAAAWTANDCKIDIGIAVGTAERIQLEIIQRADEPIKTTPLDPGILFVDEFSCQRNDGSDKHDGVAVEWAKGTLSHAQQRYLLGLVVKVIEDYAETVIDPSGLTVMYDRDDAASD